MVSPKLITTHTFTDGQSQSRSHSPQPSPHRVQNARSVVPSLNTSLNPNSILQHGDAFRLIRSPRGPSEDESLQKRRNLGARLQVNTSGQPNARSPLNANASALGGTGLLQTVGSYPLCSPNMNMNFLPSPTCRLQNLLPSPANRMMLSPSNRLHSPVNRMMLASPRFSFNLAENGPNSSGLKSTLAANNGQLASAGIANGNNINAVGGSSGSGGFSVDMKRRPEDELGFDDLLLYSDPFLATSPAAMPPLTPMSSQGEPEIEPMTPRQGQNGSQNQGQAQGEEMYKLFKRAKGVKQESGCIEAKDPPSLSNSTGGRNVKSMPGSAFSLEDSGVDEQLFSLNINPANLQLSLDATPLPNENTRNSINKRRRISRHESLQKPDISHGEDAPFIDERKYVQYPASKLQTPGRDTKGSRGSRSSAKGETDREKVSIEFLDLVKKSSREKQEGMQQEFICPHAGCNRKFSWKWAMEEHARTHMQDSDRVHICSYCGKGFFTPGCLKSHTRIHTRKPYSYVCKVEGCDKKYSTSEGLRLHTRNHHDLDKKWKCPSPGCTKSFVRQSDMRLHIIRIHSTDRPYPW